jgi:hypothetical protein
MMNQEAKNKSLGILANLQGITQGRRYNVHPSIKAMNSRYTPEIKVNEYGDCLEHENPEDYGLESWKDLD